MSGCISGYFSSYYLLRLATLLEQTRLPYASVWWEFVYLFERAGEKVDERQSEDYSQHPALSQ